MICPLKYAKEPNFLDKARMIPNYQCDTEECAWWYKGKELECCAIKLIARASVDILRNSK